ncbi:UNVERIFIED_CONTAM: hypothetical protein GTU68_046832 [Idotea baltica]|nr:hypothetical protein [Idotea baltica]
MAHDLMQVDPHNKSRYELNLKSFKEQLTQLNAQLKPELKVLKSKKYFVFHDAYGYFESYYGLNHQGAFDLSGSVSPGAKHLAELREQLEQAGSSCLFTESAVRERLAYTLTHGLDVHMVELDPLGYNLSVKPASYSEFLTGLSHRMSSCLQNL